MSNFKTVSAMLAQRAEEVAKFLYRDGIKEGHEWCIGSVLGEPGRSLKIHLAGDKAGVWADFSTGQSGDLIDLWAFKMNLKPIEALKEAEHYLGIGNVEFKPIKPLNFSKPKNQNINLLTENSVVKNYLMNERKLSSSIIQAFKITEENNQIVFNYIRNDEIILKKYLALARINDKKQIRVEKDCEPCLFGWHMLPDNCRKIALTEGELDCMSLTQYGIPSLSIPFGGGKGSKHAWIEYEFDRLQAFDEIYLCMDNDIVGQETVIDLAQRLGRYKCKNVILPYKDANECLMKNVSPQKINECFLFAKTLDPAELKRISHFIADAINKNDPRDDVLKGYNTPWKYLKNKVLFRNNELSIWTGINGHGKSQFLGHIVLNCMKEGAKVCIASLEMAPVDLLLRLVKQAGAVGEPTTEYMLTIFNWLEDKLWLFDLLGTAKIDHLLEVFTYAHQKYGIDVFVIDSFMKCDIDEDDYNAQKIFMNKICAFKNEFNCHVHLVVHPRKPQDETIKVGKLDVKGASTITDMADNCFTVWRNKQKENDLEFMKISKSTIEKDKKYEQLNQNYDCFFYCNKQRKGKWEGHLGLMFDKDCFRYYQANEPRILPIVDFCIQKE